MSQSKNGMELCALLLQETYGELASRIFTILMRRGRLQIHAICKHGRLKTKQVRHGLVALLQQNLLYFFEAGGGTFYEANDKAAYWLVRTGRILEAVETGHGSTAREVVQNLLLLGHLQVSNLHAAIENQKPLENGLSNDNAVINGTKGSAHHNASPSKRLDSTVVRLLRTGLIQTFTKGMLRTVTDSWNEVSGKVSKSDKYKKDGPKGAKEKATFDKEVQDQVRAQLRPEKLGESKKRPHNDGLNGVNRNGKRRRLSNDGIVVNGESSHEYEYIELDRNLFLRVNYEKFDVLFRNERLVELSFERIGSTTSKVFAELLRLIAKEIDRCRPDPIIDNLDDIPEDPTITTKQLFAALSPSIELSHGIGKVDGKKLVDRNFLKKMYKKRELARQAEAKAAADKAAKEAKESGVVVGIEVPDGEVVAQHDANVNGQDDADDDEDDDESVNGDHDMNGNIPEVDEDESDNQQEDPLDGEPSANKRSKVTFADDSVRAVPVDDRETQLAQLKDHLTLLAADEYCFIRQCGENGYGEWTVDFDDLAQHLRQSEIDSIVRENFGKSGHRLVQMMRKDGKIDEKNLPNTALLNQRGIRTKLAEMQMAGMIEVQGVPRDSAHTVNRMIFLWYFDQVRVAEILLDNMYKVMSRHLERLDIERRRSSDIIALSERTDVRDGTEKLTDSQLSTLKQFRDKEDKLLAEMVRYDGLVGIFRDY